MSPRLGSAVASDATCTWDGTFSGLYEYARCQGRSIGSTGSLAGSAPDAPSDDDPCTAPSGFLDRVQCELRQIENRALIVIVGCIVGAIAFLLLIGFLIYKLFPRSFAYADPLQSVRVSR